MMFYPEKYIGSDPSAQNALHKGLRAKITTALHQLNTIAATKPAWLGAQNPTALDFYIAGCLSWCALYPKDAPRDWFTLAEMPALHAMCRHLKSLPCTHALQTAEGLGPTPFSAPTYANPPHGSAT